MATSASQHRSTFNLDLVVTALMKGRLMGKKVHHESLKERCVACVLIWMTPNPILSLTPRSGRRTREHQNKHLFIKRHSKRRRPIMKEDQIKPRHLSSSSRPPPISIPCQRRKWTYHDTFLLSRLPTRLQTRESYSENATGPLWPASLLSLIGCSKIPMAVWFPVVGLDLSKINAC